MVRPGAERHRIRRDLGLAYHRQGPGRVVGGEGVVRGGPVGSREREDRGEVERGDSDEGQRYPD